MDTPLKDHIKYLERRLETLNEEIMGSRSQQDRNRIESEIRAASLALAHYRTAFELEQSLSRGL